MIYHVLPGDAQVEEFRKTGLEGEVIVFREALISGPLESEDINDFWERRAHYILAEYGDDEIAFQEKVADEILRLNDVGEGDEVNLWFEYELFCGVNLWYCLDQLNNSGAAVYRVAPTNASPDDVWEGFGHHDADDLAVCFESRVELTREELETGSQLWRAFRDRDTGKLRVLGDYRSPAFPFLKEVCEAAAEIDTRPAKVVDEIRASGRASIEEVFPEFRKRAGVYGFGDVQVERLLERT